MLRSPLISDNLLCQPSKSKKVAVLSNAQFSSKYCKAYKDTGKHGLIEGTK